MRNPWSIYFSCIRKRIYYMFKLVKIKKKGETLDSLIVNFRNYKKWKWQRKTLDPQSSWGWQQWSFPRKRESRKYFFLSSVKRKKRKTLDPQSSWGWQVTWSPIKDFGDDSGGHSRESGNPGSISSFLLILILTSQAFLPQHKHEITLILMCAST